jgi:HSP20 family protein
MMLKNQCSLPKTRSSFDDLFGRFFGDSLADFYGQEARRGNMPRTNISETDGGYELAFELPGVAEADIQVQLHERTLTVKANRLDARKTDGEATDGRRWHRVEHRYGEFSRAIQLPKNAADDGVEAVYKNGVLTVTVPKQAEAKPAQIAVRAE